MISQRRHPRILVVTPEVTSLPRASGAGRPSVCARAGGLGDVCAAQMRALCEQGVDVHLAIPNYRHVFQTNTHRGAGLDFLERRGDLPENRVHLVQDRCFYYHSKLFRTTGAESIRIALAFQREVINSVIPRVQPDLIHCYDWMTGLVPALARRIGIPCIFTLYRLESPRLPLAAIEDRGIDAAAFWQDCYYTRMPVAYEETRESNPLDLLTSAVFAARMVTALSPAVADALTAGPNPFAAACLIAELQHKRHAGSLCAVSPAPDPSFNPAADPALFRAYGPESHFAGKLFNKLALQETLHLRMDSTVPLCFWPTRLDAARHGCRLMAEVLPVVLERYRRQGLQVVFIADGDTPDSRIAA